MREVDWGLVVAGLMVLALAAVTYFAHQTAERARESSDRPKFIQMPFGGVKVGIIAMTVGGTIAIIAGLLGV